MEKSYKAKLDTTYGLFNIQCFKENGNEHIALWMGEIQEDDNIIVRAQSSCTTSNVFKAIRCDCSKQTDMALEIIEKEKKGIFIYLDEEGRGHGMFEKINALNLMNNGCDTITSLTNVGKKVDERNHSTAVFIVKELIKSQKIKLLTNNPEKIKSFESYGFKVIRIPIEITPTPYTKEYLKIKKEVLNHLISNI